MFVGPSLPRVCRDSSRTSIRLGFAHGRLYVCGTPYDNLLCTKFSSPNKRLYMQIIAYVTVSWMYMAMLKSYGELPRLCIQKMNNLRGRKLNNPHMYVHRLLFIEIWHKRLRICFKGEHIWTLRGYKMYMNEINVSCEKA